MRLHKKYLFYFTLALHYSEWLKINCSCFTVSLWNLEDFRKI